jgi:hypothetical protein
MSNFDFITAVIDLAVGYGFEIDEEQYASDIAAFNNETLDEDTFYSVLDALDWTYEDALDYLNDIHNPAGRVWYVEDQSLFMEESDE